MPDLLPFPAFPECTDIETVVYALLDDEEFDSSLLDDELRDLAPTFNADGDLNQGLARIVFRENVQAELLFVLHNVSTRMNETETNLFVRVVADSLDDVLVDYDLTQVNVFNQQTSSDDRRLQRQLDENYNQVSVSLSAACSASDNCTSNAFQKTLNKDASEYAQMLLDDLVREASVQGNYSYFLDISNVSFMLDEPDEADPEPSNGNDNPPNDNRGGNNKKLSMSAILSIVATVFTVLVFAIICCCLRRRKRMSLKDPEDQVDDRDGSQGYQFGYGYETDEEEDKFDPNQQLPTKYSSGLREDEYDDDESESSYEGEFSVQAGDFTVVDGYSVSSDGQPLTKEPFEEKHSKKKKKKHKKKKKKHKHKSHY